MYPLRYYPMLRRSKDPIYLRFELVRYAREHGIKPATRQFGTTVKTVHKWLRRWEPGSLRGLEDRSRAPLNPRRGVTAAQRRRAVSLKRRLPSWGASRMKRDFSLTLSEKALRRIWREEGLLRRKRRKHKTKQCLREVKKRWRLFEQMSVDTKDLCDIPELWAQAKALGLPRYQYTAREVVSGWHYVSYAQECTLAYSKLFAEFVLAHLVGYWNLNARLVAGFMGDVWRGRNSAPAPRIELHSLRRLEQIFATEPPRPAEEGELA